MRGESVLFPFPLKMTSFHLILTIDSHPGCDDYSFLSDQDLMEVLIDSFAAEARKRYKDNNGEYLDVCKWPRVACDAANRVVSVKDIRGTAASISLSNIPSKLQYFELCRSSLSGTLETAALPQHMKSFSIGSNAFHGTVDFAALPPAISEFSILQNEFSGSADLSDLPQSLTDSWIHRNKFTGTLCLTSLPPNLKSLDVSENGFTGNFKFLNAPKPLQSLYAFENRFNSIAVVPKSSSARLFNSGVTIIINEDGHDHEKARYML